MPDCTELLPKKEQAWIDLWCNQIPVIGFNFGSYDLTLIQKYFAEQLTDKTNNVGVAEKGEADHVLVDRWVPFPAKRNG